MYILIFFIHFLFIVWSYYLGFPILEGIFIFLFAFFVLYFSPFFFTKEKITLPSFSFDLFSPKKSITLPLIFLYGAIYVFLFALLSSIIDFISIGTCTLIWGFLLFFWYMLITEWKNDIFFDVTRIHLVMSYCVLFFICIISFFTNVPFTTDVIILIFISLLFSYFFFRVSLEELSIFFQAGLLLFIISFYVIWVYFMKTSDYWIFLSIIITTSILLFEIIPKFSFFSRFFIESRITTLGLVLFSNIGLMALSFFNYSYFIFIALSLIFLLSVHTRYCNYVSFFIGILSLFFLYWNTFFSLMTDNEIFSSLLFVFFLPLCIIWSTYFWEEKFPYDFLILHYTSIAFSSIFSLYAIFFVRWSWVPFFFISGVIFLTGILLLLSFFRFRYN